MQKNVHSICISYQFLFDLGSLLFRPTLEAFLGVDRLRDKNANIVLVVVADVHRLRSQRLEGVLQLRSTCDKNAEAVNFPSGDRFESLYEILSVHTFVQGIEDDVRVSGCLMKGSNYALQRVQ